MKRLVEILNPDGGQVAADCEAKYLLLEDGRPLMTFSHVSLTEAAYQAWKNEKGCVQTRGGNVRA